MNRRSFLTSLLGSAVAAAVAPTFLKGAGRTWRKTKQGLIVPNPAYAEAPFEAAFIWDKRAYEFLVHQGSIRPHLMTKENGSSMLSFTDEAKSVLSDPFPLRFMDAAMIMPVPPFIEI